MRPSSFTWLVVAAVLVLPLAACGQPSRPSVDATPSTPPISPAPAATTGAATARPSLSPSPSPSLASPAARDWRYEAIRDATAAFERMDYSTALRLYRQAAGGESPAGKLEGQATSTEAELRAFARFRIVVADALVGQEDDARAILEEMRSRDAGTPFLRLALTFWDTYGMTADPRTACGQVTRLVREQPEAYLRALNGSDPSGRRWEADDICRLP